LKVEPVYYPPRLHLPLRLQVTTVLKAPVSRRSISTYLRLPLVVNPPKLL